MKCHAQVAGRQLSTKTLAMGAIPVVGSFIELLNTSNQNSAIVVFAQNADATPRADSDSTMMIDSML